MQYLPPNACLFDAFYVYKKSKAKGFNSPEDKKTVAFRSAFLAKKRQVQKIGGELVFSADLCYNGMGNENGRTEKSKDHSFERCRL